jgi:hypothetical protein
MSEGSSVNLTLKDRGLDDILSLRRGKGSMSGSVGVVTLPVSAVELRAIGEYFSWIGLSEGPEMAEKGASSSKSAFSADSGEEPSSCGPLPFELLRRVFSPAEFSG